MRASVAALLADAAASATAGETLLEDEANEHLAMIKASNERRAAQLEARLQKFVALVAGAQQAASLGCGERAQSFPFSLAPKPSSVPFAVAG